MSPKHTISDGRRMRPAVFLDRDGTLIEHVHYLSDPADVQLVQGGAEAVRRLQRAGYACVVITNQSAVGRGMLSEAGLADIHRVMDRQLAECDVTLDGLYYCTVVPMQQDQTVIEHPDRKPGAGMLQRAERELGLDLSRSWMVGDSLSDMAAGRNAGCCGTILVRTGYGSGVDPEHASIDYIVDHLSGAAELILERAGHDAAKADVRPTHTIKGTKENGA